MCYKGKILEGLNHTHICLIPDAKELKFINEYRLISFCNIVCKIAVKVLANQLKNILGDVIDESQSTFVLSRLITDNMLIAYEFHHINIIGHNKR